MKDGATSTLNSVPQINLDALFNLFFSFFKKLLEGDGFIRAMYWTWDAINFVAVFTAPALFFGIIYVIVRTRQMHEEEHERFKEKTIHVRGERKGDQLWQKIVAMVSSDNPVEWRQGIIDADVLLEKVLTEKGYVGDSLGEKLRNLTRDSLRSLNSAWEAHKVRNEIAHSGSNFILTQREARRVIEMYRQVFDELGVL